MLPFGIAGIPADGPAMPDKLRRIECMGANMKKYLIGIDIGTQGTKAGLFDESLNMLGMSFEESKLISPEPGTVWQNPDDLYHSCANVVRALVEKAGIDAHDIQAIGLDGQMAGIMGVAEDGSASTVYDSWLDMRCAPYAEEMADRCGRRIIELSGGSISYTHGAKILWLKHERPELYEKTAKFVMPHTYVVMRMTGLDASRAYLDYTHLHFSNLADMANLDWSDELTAAFGIPKCKLPKITSPFEIAGETDEAFARLSGTYPGIPVVMGCGDTAAGTFGSGMFEPGQMLDIAGTASVLTSVVDRYVPDVENATLTIMRSPIKGLFMPLAYVNGGGMCIRCLRNIMGTTYGELEREAVHVASGSEGLIFIPHFSGRAFPHNPHFKGAYVGLDFIHTRAHMYRAVMESIAYEYSCYLNAMRSLYPEYPFDRLISMGGGAQSPLFCQIKANVLGVTVETVEMGETALIGSAAIAGFGTGAIDDYEALIRSTRCRRSEYVPDFQETARYRSYLKKYLLAMDKLTVYYKDSQNI